MDERTQPAAALDEIGDIDDVEAHGLKEVAAGVGAAALIGGAGAGAALASNSATTSEPAKGTPIVKMVVGTAEDTKDEMLKKIRDNHAPERGQSDGMQARSTSGGNGADATAILPVENPVVKLAKTVKGTATETASAAADKTTALAADIAEKVRDRVKVQPPPNN